MAGRNTTIQHPQFLYRDLCLPKVSSESRHSVVDPLEMSSRRESRSYRIRSIFCEYGLKRIKILPIVIILNEVSRNFNIKFII